MQTHVMSVSYPISITVFGFWTKSLFSFSFLRFCYRSMLVIRWNVNQDIIAFNHAKMLMALNALKMVSNVLAISQYFHAVGLSFTAVGQYLHALGLVFTAVGQYFHALGLIFTAVGQYFHAVGLF